MSLAQEMTAALQGSWRGHYGVARCPGHEDRSPSLSLADGATGKLLLTCHAGCSFEHITEALAKVGFAKPSDRCQSTATERKALERARDVQTKKRGQMARAIWQRGQPIAGTLAEQYLRLRGITTILPRSLRYQEHCWHISGARLPAMLSYVEGADGFAIHRTYLADHPPRKANVAPAKTMLGQTKGGAVRFSAGGEYLAVAEGVETALSLASGLLPGKPSVWATLSTGGMKALRLPAKSGRLLIASDGDDAGREAAQALAERADLSGWSVHMAPAPDGQDWNDVLQKRALKP